MSLKDRLSRLAGEVPEPLSPDPRQDRVAELRRRLDRAMDRSGPTLSAGMRSARQSVTLLEHIVSGEEAHTPHGTFFVSQTTFKASDLHGHARICDLACASVEAASLLAGCPMVKGVSLSDGLFLDTETTGLAGGTGTFPFLIGLGWFEASSFVTCQLFARDFSEEGAMLSHLREVASAKQFLVTFNGKAFDMNLLATRFILNRCREPLSAMPHVDLLHLGRRILGHRLEDARLSTIEARVLGVEREGDVPGSEIPQRYFDWLRKRDGRLLEDVFIHNRLDIVSMASLLKYLTDLIDDRRPGDGHHGDLLKAACLLQDRGDGEKAGKMLERLISSRHGNVAACARRSLSLLYRKAHRWEEAAGLWQDLVSSDPCDFFAMEELAKFYEHHTHEFGKASQLVQTLLSEAAGLSDDERVSAERRLRRLLAKVARR
ncbi:MAG TPA: ribonuclease H-like domain-containing protein [Syntrophorhabdales bacterium]|nr:ribonuclease H-like domain-containing protein [Syntrophorhabdales bacterium]